MERPANIVQRRLEQGGHDPADGVELLSRAGVTEVVLKNVLDEMGGI